MTITTTKTTPTLMMPREIDRVTMMKTIAQELGTMIFGKRK